MRDVGPKERLCINNNTKEAFIFTEDAKLVPLHWENMMDWARWWIRQSELKEDIKIRQEQRRFFQLVLDGKFGNLPMDGSFTLKTMMENAKTEGLL